jgi:hypothetical protein
MDNPGHTLAKVLPKTGALAAVMLQPVVPGLTAANDNDEPEPPRAAAAPGPTHRGAVRAPRDLSTNLTGCCCLGHELGRHLSSRGSVPPNGTKQQGGVLATEPKPQILSLDVR